ncbi:MAG TPA: hypothetical protein GYA07_03560 [Verrucomicrobia bacterium]|nr:hypothetical protein [Verrucomicrobiota bacterium]HOP96640.1 hypothetical protein [Verrucomicrobiota bacterium]HPU55990.1 hypothetical protein [Verrucomicrobiota bacterium]
MTMNEAQQQVIKAIAEGSITADAEGRVVLPEDLKAASEGGEIFVSKNPGTEFSILFIVESSPEETRGLLYCEKNLPSAGQTFRIGGREWKVTMVSGPQWGMVSGK